MVSIWLVLLFMVHINITMISPWIYDYETGTMNI